MALAGKNLAFTGALATKRAEATALAEAAGATVKSCVSANTDIVVAGADAVDSEKMTKAKAKGVAIWTEADFLAAVAGKGKAAAGGAAGDVRVAQQADGHDNVALRTRKNAEPDWDLPNGSSVQVLKEEGDWCQISFEGKKGWVKSRNLKSAGKRANETPERPAPAKKAKTEAAVSKAAVKDFVEGIGLDWAPKEIGTLTKELEKYPEDFQKMQDNAKTFKKFVRTSLHAKTKAVGKGQKLGHASHFGGTPWVKNDGDWPTCARCDNRMSFVLQVNFDEVDVPADSGIKGKNDGLLQVWECVGDCSCGGEEGTSFARLVPKKDLAKGKEGVSTDGVQVFPAAEVKEWIRKKELPGHHEEDEEYGDVVESFTVYEKKEVLDALVQVHGNKIGGWPNWCQCERYHECPQCGEEMRNVLFNLECSGIKGFGIGDGGTAVALQCAKHKSQVVWRWDCC